MVAVSPFRALRYDAGRVGGLSRVIAPPYDVISPEQQEELYAASPYNVVRLIFGKQAPSDHDGDNRYTRAKADFDAWRASGVLVREPQPAVYLCEHAFLWDGVPYRRLGCIARLEFDDETPRQVLAHEATFEGPKADRAKLLEAVRAHLSPVFCIASDGGETLAAQWRRHCDAASPAAEARLSARLGGGVGDQEEIVRLWVVREAQAMAAMQEAFRAATVCIADGHHRFAVAYAHRHLCHGVMTCFSWGDDPALRLQPIHRVTRVGEAAAQALERLAVCEPAAGPEELLPWVVSAGALGRFGVYRQGRCFRVTVRPERLAAWQKRGSAGSPGLSSLNVSVLHQLLLPELLAPGADAEAVCYTPHPAQAMAMADGSASAWAWFVPPIGVRRVVELAREGIRMPQKTTYFYPKVLSGLVINPFDA